MNPFEVTVVVRRTTRFPVIEGHTPEHAEAIAEAYVNDGETGELVEQEIESIEAQPATEEFVLAEAA